MDFSRDYSTNEFIEALLLDELERNNAWYQYENEIVKILKYCIGINYDCDYLTLFFSRKVKKKLITTGFGKFLW